MKRAEMSLALLLTVCVLTVSTLAAGCAFTDLGGSSAAKAIEGLQAKGLVNGVGEDRFAPK